MKSASLSLQFNRSCCTWAACASFVLVAPILCLAQEGGDAQPPVTAEPAAPALEAKEVVARYVKALGGESAIRKQKSRMMKGELSDAMMGSAPVVIYFAAPNRMLMEMEIPEAGQARYGFDGEVAWNVLPVYGPAVLDDEQREATRDQADFYGEVNFDKRFKSMEAKGEREFDGVKCYALKMVSQKDDESTYFFEVDSGLLRGTTPIQDAGMGPMEMISIHKEYKEFGGVKFPVHTEIEMMGMVRSMKFTTIEIDTVKDEIFALPAEIKALIEADKADAEPATPEPAKPEPKKEEN